MFYLSHRSSELSRVALGESVKCKSSKSIHKLKNPRNTELIRVSDQFPECLAGYVRLLARICPGSSLSSG
jgi:hypothetical protein